MAKRADSNIIKQLPVSQKYKNYLASNPLIDFSDMVVDDDSTIYPVIRSIERVVDNIGLLRFNVLLTFNDSPGEKLIHVVEIKKHTPEYMGYAVVITPIFDLVIEQSKISKKIESYSAEFDESLRDSPDELAYSVGFIETDTESLTHKIMKQEDMTEEFSRTVSDRVKLYLTSIGSFFLDVDQADLYPVSKRGKHRHQHSKKAHLRHDLETIVFLNKLPSEKDPHKGGSHSSPKAHQRRGHFRTLKHEKYGDNVGKTTYIKPQFIGDKEKIVNGVTYKLMQQPNKDL